MTTPTLTLASGRQYQIPLFDPFVAEHFASSSSYVGTLLEQINSGLYGQFFKDKADLTFLDLGANIGLVSLYAAPSCKRIVAVEPAPATHRVLRAMTLPFPNIELMQAALAPEDAQVSFFVNDVNSTASSTVNTYGTKITVPGLKLSSIIRINQLSHVDVCKCDAEGSEGESLTFEELQAAAPIVSTYMIEFHNCPRSTWEQKLGNTVRDLARLGYYKMTVDGMALIASK